MKLDAARFDRAMNINRDEHASRGARGMAYGIAFSVVFWAAGVAAVAWMA
jgi:hypothetical protein